MAGREQPTGRIPQIVPGPERFLGRQRRGGAPRGGVPVFARDGPRLASVASRPTSATTGSAPPGAPPAPSFSGSELQLTPRTSGASPPKRRQMQRRCGGDKEDTTQQPGRRKCAAGTRCAARRRPRSGLFDIVKKDAAPTVLGRRRVTMAVVLAEGEELDSNILQVGPRNRANSHAMQRRALLLRDSPDSLSPHAITEMRALVASIIDRRRRGQWKDSHPR